MTELLSIGHGVRKALEGWFGVWAWLTVPIVAGAFVYSLRRFTPGLWLWFESYGPKDRKAAQVVQALPSVLVGAGVSAMGANLDPWFAVYGAGAALLAPLAHHALKALPVPYQGAVREMGKRVVRGSTLLVLVVLTGCSGRQRCLLDADRAAHQAYLDECDGYADTRVCPFGDAIEKRHEEAQKACPQ